MVPGLVDKAKDLSLVDRADNRRQVRVAGKQQAHGRRLQPSHLGQKLDASHTRHALIADDHIDLRALQDLETCGT